MGIVDPVTGAARQVTEPPGQSVASTDAEVPNRAPAAVLEHTSSEAAGNPAERAVAGVGIVTEPPEAPADLPRRERAAPQRTKRQPTGEAEAEAAGAPAGSGPISANGLRFGEDCLQPWNLFDVYVIPRAVLTSPELDPGPKLLLARLLGYIGKNQSAYPSDKTLAGEMSVDVRTLERWQEQLRPILRRVRKGPHAPSCTFLRWHPLLAASLKAEYRAADLSLRRVDPDRADLRSRRRSKALQDPTSVSGQGPSDDPTCLSVRPDRNCSSDPTELSGAFKEEGVQRRESVQGNQRTPDSLPCPRAVNPSSSSPGGDVPSGNDPSTSKPTTTNRSTPSEEPKQHPEDASLEGKTTDPKPELPDEILNRWREWLYKTRYPNGDGRRPDVPFARKLRGLFSSAESWQAYMAGWKPKQFKSDSYGLFETDIPLWEQTGPETRRDLAALSAQPAAGGATEDQQLKWFEVFWNEFWLRRGRKPAWEAFRAKVTTRGTFDMVLSATQTQQAEMLQREPAMRPQAAKWLNDERWDDEPDPAKVEVNPYEVFYPELP